MQRSRKPRSPIRARWLLTGVLVVTMAVLGAPVAAAAGSPVTSGPATSGPVTTGPVAGTAEPSVVAACPTPKKGQSTCFALRRTDVPASHGLRPMAALPSGYGPADLRSAYSLPADGGAGATVAIVDAYDNPNAESDLAVYRQQYGLPACTTANGCFRKVDEHGGTSYPAPDAGWAGEIALDLDMVSAVAPQAHILLVEADSSYNSDLGASVDEAVALGAKFVSNSYGSGYSTQPGSGEDPSEATSLDPYYNHPGVAVVASSGDSKFGVSYPAASQYVTSVGGTSLTRAGNARGWTESVWNNSYGGPGSGCSLYEPKPSFQTDTVCSKRTVADVAAVADPTTGVAVYQTYGGGGWNIYGGTSVASPIIASVYASAGTPVSGTYPNSYPYADTSALNDVTTGNNATCSPAYWCTAGPGYDGPTGLGTPSGVAAFGTGPHGEVTGTVTDSATGSAISGATVQAGNAHTIADAQGHYDMTVPVGSYDVTAAGYGYQSSTVPGVSVADGSKITENFPLTALPHSTVSGTVTDSSGHGWPLYAKITADGVPGGPVFTDPATGHYSLNLPQGQTYQLHVTPVYDGYQSAAAGVTLGTTDQTVNIGVPVDTTACDAPGYQTHFAGTTQSFDTTTAPAGWTIDNGTGTSGWQFTDDGGRGNLTGGTGGFAIVDSHYAGSGATENTTLTAPATDLSAVANPTVSFDTDYPGYFGQTADADISVDGGGTWTTIWHQTFASVRTAHVELPVPQAAGKSSVLVRFHFTGSNGWWWQLDNVFIGSRSCDPVPGGLVFGEAADANTQAALGGVLVSTADATGVRATTAATPDDPNLGEGFYWLFSPATGSHPFTAVKGRYTTATDTVNVAADSATRADFTLKAGQVTATPTSINKTVGWGGRTSATVTVKNTGTAPATVNVGEQPGGFSLLAQGGAPLNKVSGTYSNRWQHSSGTATTNAKAAADATPADAPWTPIADYPTPIQDNLAAANGGEIYSAFGYNGGAGTSALYAYDPVAGVWNKLASAADIRERPAGGFINGKLYAVGGWDSTGAADPKLEIYNPATDSWSTGASDPKPYAASGSAVVGGKLYVVGGCAANSCGSRDVQVYDPAGDSWTSAAAYPEPVSWESCGAIAGKLYCAGGNNDAGTSMHSYVYDPATDAWSPLASMPIDLWGSAYTAANGRLLVSGGVTNSNRTITNQGFAYDPGTNTWTPLPNANNTLYRGGSACGLYQIGGNPGGSFGSPRTSSEVLPGFADCADNTDIPWLSESPASVTLQPGASAQVTVALDAGVTAITQPGTYAGEVVLSSDTPYLVAPVAVSMTVKPPKSWGKVTGTVTSAVDGSPLAGATLVINTWAASYSMKTDKNGQYGLWLDARANPLQIIVAKDGYLPQATNVTIKQGRTTTSNFALKKS
jgi:N-acetylneuraminic acid mutarotase